MKVLAFDSVGGASGDMILASLISLGIDPDMLSQALSTLGLGEIRISVAPSTSCGLAGLRLHLHGAEHDEHVHEQGHAAGAHSHAPHRGFPEIVALISQAKLPESVKAQAIRVFRRIGEIEARLHGTTVEQIHFHEIGAFDSIVDIVGSCLALAELGVDAVVVGPLPLGTGTIRCAHGVFPNPAPATLELLRGMPVEQTNLPFELVTPTGAALLSEWKTMERVPAGAKPLAIGYGLGTRELGDRPNLLRATLFELANAPETGFQGDSSHDVCVELETNVDDMTPELVGLFVQRALASGALDVFTTAVMMKKQRPGILLTLLCRMEDRERMLDLIFRETTTLGVRERLVTRTILDRRIETVSTPFGDVRVKIGKWKGREVVHTPEFEDCIRLAAEGRVAVREVYDAVKRAIGECQRDRPAVS